ncbi:hypothetical protein N9P55_01625 [bacterium]|nr:hypothetical protein [bacterium]
MKKKTSNTDNEFPNLENLKSQNGFKTPTGYFDSLHDSIMNEVKEETKVRKVSFYKVFAYAASILVIVGVSSILFFSTPDTLEDYDFESIVLNYEEISVDDYVDEFSEIDLELDENLLFDELAMN